MLALIVFLWSIYISELSAGTKDESFRMLARSIQREGNQCIVQFQACIDTYFGFFDDFQENYTTGSTIMIDRDGMDASCQLSQTFQSCLEGLREICRSDPYWGIQREHYYITLQRYVCSQTGRNDFLKTNGSHCDQNVNVNLLRFQCERSVQKMYQQEKDLKTERYREKSYCSYLQEYRQCSVMAIRQACGHAIAELIANIDHTMNEERYAVERTMSGC